MTAPTLDRPAAGGRPVSPAPRPAPTASPRGRSDARRTLLVAAGSLLGMVPLKAVFADVGWFVELIAFVVLIVGPAALLRLQRRPTVLQLLPGIVLAAVFGYLLYLRGAGIIPSQATVDLVRQLADDAAQLVRTSGTPVTSTPALRMEVVPALALVVVVIDWWAVVHRAPALAGIPLLAVFTTSGAIADSVTWWQFVAGAAGYLLMLAADSRDVLIRWGRIVSRRQGDVVTRAGLGLAGRRIGLIAIVVAVVLPLAIPGLGRNLLSDALNGKSGNGSGQGNGSGTALSPLASLKGQLNRSTKTNLFSVQLSGTDRAFYLRSKVLERYTSKGFVLGDASATNSIGRGLDQLGAAGGTRHTYEATINIDNLRDTGAPIFATPTELSGLQDWLIAPEQTVLVDNRTNSDLTYTEQVNEPAATPDQLNAAVGRPTEVDPALSREPANLPSQIRTVVAQQTRGATTPYAKANALYNYFRDGTNGFSYSLETDEGNSTSDLVNFLQNKRGYCQQYAAAMAVMLRVAGVPSRVVLGYTHNSPDDKGRFTVTNYDSHAWVEAYFEGIGWYPFDPTPLAGSDGARQQTPLGVPTPGVPTDQPSGSSVPSSRVPSSVPRRTVDPNQDSATAAATDLDNGSVLPPWLLPTLLALVVVVVLLGWAPATRAGVRRRRLRKAGRTGQVDPLWQELAAIAVDTGLGWSATRTPRQVVPWLTEHGAPADGVSRLAGAVEREWYAGPSSSPPATGSTAADVVAGADRLAVTARALRSRLPWRQRLISRLYPRSLFRRPGR